MLPPHTKVDVHKVRYPVVRQALNSCSGMIDQTKDDVTALIIWWDGFIPKEQFLNVFPYQRISKVPGMDFLCYKSTTFKALNHMRNSYPKIYNFFPTTYLLPFQFMEFQKEHLKLAASNKDVAGGYPITWIFKPRSGCCGNGIKLIQNSFEVADSSYSGVIQKYIPPYLIDGYKFDFRFYIFLATVEPFTAYIYKEGLTRFCTRKYVSPTKENLNDKFCHLTNTAVNVNNTGNSNTSGVNGEQLNSNVEVKSQSEILKLSSKVIENIKINDPRGNVLWKRIKEIAALVMLAQYNNIIDQIRLQETENRAKQKPCVSCPGPTVPFNKKFFHIIGIDILLNENCEPMILEMNDRPSMCVTFDIENTLKTKIVKDVLNLISIDGKPPSNTANLGDWEPILPVNDTTPFGKNASHIFEKTQQSTSSSTSISNSMVSGSGGGYAKRIYPRDVVMWKQRASMKQYKETSVLPPLHANQQ